MGSSPITGIHPILFVFCITVKLKFGTARKATAIFHSHLKERRSCMDTGNGGSIPIDRSSGRNDRQLCAAASAI